jgi:hypothetical protein
MTPSPSWIAAVLAALVACDNTPQTSSHPGTPMELSPADGPFSTARLLEIAYYYHPRTMHMKFRSYDHEHRYTVMTPEWRARVAVHKRAMANREPWREMVRELEAVLPAHDVDDRTRPYILEAAYSVGIVAKGQYQREIHGMVSALAPIYFICETHLHVPQVHPSADAAPILEILERAILERYPYYHRIDLETGYASVPDLNMGSLTYDDPILLDALFVSSW